MTLDDLRRALTPLSNRVTNMIARAILSSADDSTGVQQVQIEVQKGEIRDEVERVQNFGFTANPPKDTEIVVVFVGGRREHSLAIGSENRQYRIKNLESGEVAVYDATGSKIVLKSTGDIEVTPSSGNLKVNGAIIATGEVTANSATHPEALSSHSHNAGTALISAGSGSPVTGVTGGPV